MPQPRGFMSRGRVQGAMPSPRNPGLPHTVLSPHSIRKPRRSSAVRCWPSTMLLLHKKPPQPLARRGVLAGEGTGSVGQDSTTSRLFSSDQPRSRMSFSTSTPMPTTSRSRRQPSYSTRTASSQLSVPVPEPFTMITLAPLLVL